jgi:hypothetical protein
MMRNSTFRCTGHGIYQLKIPLVIRIFKVAAAHCKIKIPLVIRIFKVAAAHCKIKRTLAQPTVLIGINHGNAIVTVL